MKRPKREKNTRDLKEGDDARAAGDEGHVVRAVELDRLDEGALGARLLVQILQPLVRQPLLLQRSATDAAPRQQVRRPLRGPKCQRTAQDDCHSLRKSHRGIRLKLELVGS